MGFSFRLPRDLSPIFYVMSIKELKDKAFEVFTEDMAVVYCKGIADALCSLPRVEGWVARCRSGEVMFYADAKPDGTVFADMAGQLQAVLRVPGQGFIIRGNMFPALRYADGPIKVELLINQSG